MINYLLTLFWVKRVNWFNCIYMKVLQFNLLPIEKQGSAAATKPQIKTCLDGQMAKSGFFVNIKYKYKKIDT